jgi:hypothetical protein
MPKDTPTRPAPDSAADSSTLASVQAENAALKARIAEMESAKTQIAADEALIVAKMAKGLRREQARAVINRQREHDAFLKKQAEEKKAKAAAAA